MSIEDIELLTDFVDPRLLSVVLVMCIIGYMIKHNTKLPNYTIPFIITTLSVVLVYLYVSSYLGEGHSVATLVYSILQGVFIAALATYGNSVVKQVLKIKNDLNKNS